MDFPITDSMRKVIASQPLRVNANSTMMAGRSSVSTGAHAVNIAPNVNVAIFNSVDRLTNESKLVFESQITYISDEEKWSVEYGGKHYTFKDIFSQGYRMDKMESEFMSLRTTTTFVRQEALIKVRNVTIMSEAQPDMVELDAYLENGNCYAIDPIALFMALGVKKHLIINGTDKYGIAVGSQKALINKLRNGSIFLNNVWVSEVKEIFADELGLEFRISWNGNEKVATLDNVLVINEWLRLYTNPTVPIKGRIVDIPADAVKYSWAMVEDRKQINPWAKIIIENNGVAVVEHVGDHGELVDGIGDNSRYWVAVGPKVMNPDHKPEENVIAEKMKYGTKLDAVIEDNMGNIYYIPCIVGDIKEHTFPNGIYQTGYKYPNGTEFKPGNVDGSIIEFMGTASIDTLTQYDIVQIIVYE